MEEPELLTPTETAARFGVSVQTILRWAGRGWLPFVELPSGRLRFRREDVAAALAADVVDHAGD